jgi:hypothetical protein
MEGPMTFRTPNDGMVATEAVLCAIFARRITVTISNFGGIPSSWMIIVHRQTKSFRNIVNILVGKEKLFVI